jgi:hypothetical protein
VPLPWLTPVRARCVVATAVDVDLALFAYRVAAPSTGAVPEALTTGTAVPIAVPSSTAPNVKTGTARTQILDAIETLVSRSGRAEVSVHR